MAKSSVLFLTAALSILWQSNSALADTKSTQPLNQQSEFNGDSAPCVASETNAIVVGDDATVDPCPSRVGGGGPGTASLSPALNEALFQSIVAFEANPATSVKIAVPQPQELVVSELTGSWPMFTSTGALRGSNLLMGRLESARFFNPLTGYVSYSIPETSLEPEANDPKTIVCNLPQQLVWISAPGEQYLEADDVGNCAQLGGCRIAGPGGGGSNPESYFTYYNFGFGNALAVLSCNDVVVAGGGYKTYTPSGQEYFSKNAFAWRSSRPEGDRMRYLNRDVGCQTGATPLWSHESKQCGSGNICGPGVCLTYRARFAEATAISVDPANAALNIVGEMTWDATNLTTDNREGYLRASRAGFLWRGVYNYPSNAGPVNELSGNEVPKNRLSDSLQLLSTYGIDTDNFAIANQVLRTSIDGSTVLEIPGVHREYTHIPTGPLPTHIYGANWQLLSFTLGQARHLSPVVSLKDENDVEFSTTFAAAVDQGTGAMSARGISGYMGTEGQCQTSGCEHAASRFTLDSEQHVSTSLLEGNIDWGTIPPGTWQDYLWTRATAMSKDTGFTVGQAYDATTPEVGFTNGSTGDSIKYGFHQGVPVIWSDSRRPRAIALPDGYAGGIALGVTSYGTRQAIVVGTMVKSGVEQLPEGFVAVCTRGSETSICCTNAIPTKDYLASRGFTLGANVKMFNTTAAETVGNRVYFTGTGREVSGSAKPYVAKIEFSSSCQTNTCS